MHESSLKLHANENQEARLLSSILYLHQESCMNYKQSPAAIMRSSCWALAHWLRYQPLAALITDLYVVEIAEKTLVVVSTTSRLNDINNRLVCG